MFRVGDYADFNLIDTYMLIETAMLATYSSVTPISLSLRQVTLTNYADLICFTKHATEMRNHKIM